MSVHYPYVMLCAGTHWRKFLRWALAQANGHLSYHLLREASCSTAERGDLPPFGAYVGARIESGMTVLDVGCGPLPRPAYVPVDVFESCTMIGLDPFPSEFAGHFVQGIGEYIPLADASVDAVLAATSLDHTFDLSATSQELARVVKNGGHLVIWDHPLTSEHPRDRLRRLVRAPIERLTNGRKVRVYENGVVLPIPKGMADPFHEPFSTSRRWPSALKRTLESAGFVQVDPLDEHGFSSYIRT